MPLEQLKQIPNVALTFDQDQMGKEMAQQLMQDMPHASRHAPTEKN